MAVPGRSAGSAPSLGVMAILVVVLLSEAGCGAPGAEPAATTESMRNPDAVDTDSPFPDSVAVLGHSSATGLNSDPARPGQDAPENSWATGSNPDVQSIATRVATENPAAAGRTWNVAVDGSGYAQLLDQAEEIVGIDDLPELILIVTVDNDMRCDGTNASNYEPFAQGLGEVLDVLEEGAPESRVMIVSQWGTVQAWADAAFPVSPAVMTGPGPCGLVDPSTGQLNPERIAALQAIADHYQTRVDRECAARANCETDGGAARALPVNLDTLSSDMNHLSISGHTALAALVWEALFP